MVVPVKKGLKALESSGLLDSSALATLRRYSITSVEELVGALGSRRGAVAELLGISDRDARSLQDRALAVLSPEVQNELEETGRREFRPAYGARVEPSRDQ